MYHINHDDFETLGILNISTRVEQLHLNHVFNIFYDICPDYMKLNFIKLSSLHNHDTRGRDFNFHVPKVKSVGSASFCHNAINIWNKLPNDIKNNSLKSNFKKDAKTFLLTNMIV